ncbi:MAG: DinB family protein [Chloroflexi bacterium]|nr:DinB family protein [Chloroflexota bacterium]
MVHPRCRGTEYQPYVSQLWFTRSEFLRCLEGVSAEDALRRLGRMNCLSWIVGHTANQEQRLWVKWAQGREVILGLNELVGYGKPASTPPWDDMCQAWQRITQVGDDYLRTITVEMLPFGFQVAERPNIEPVGKLLLRNIYHYWFHLGEAHAIRQILGHPDLPDFVGNLSQVQV